MNTRYTIVVDGRLDPRWAPEFGPLRLTTGVDGTTTLSGPVRDQSELHGHIRRIEDLGLRLVSVDRAGGTR